ncbi:hypothetical protein MRX96_042982 [Rhipicephalus microplus]
MAAAWRRVLRGLPGSRLDSLAPVSGRPIESGGRWAGVPLTTSERLPGTPPFSRKGRSSVPLAPRAGTNTGSAEFLTVATCLRQSRDANFHSSQITRRRRPA